MAVLHIEYIRPQLGFVAFCSADRFSPGGGRIGRFQRLSQGQAKSLGFGGLNERMKTPTLIMREYQLVQIWLSPQKHPSKRMIRQAKHRYTIPPTKYFHSFPLPVLSIPSHLTLHPPPLPASPVAIPALPLPFTHLALLLLDLIQPQPREAKHSLCHNLAILR